ncbi:MAG TPA: L-seryl-tRNA(Sec) selenium transferase [Phycisphaerae bacterium]|nr:L-seryl-tRNA(Sec) selenium transferase [Phycisphaerae bacterium]
MSDMRASPSGRSAAAAGTGRIAPADAVDAPVGVGGGPRRLPAVDRAVRELEALKRGVPRPVLVRLVRRELAELRETEREIPLAGGGEAEVMQRLRRAAEALAQGRVRPVINATGVIIHTNLGRAPLGEAAARAVYLAAGQYTTLEYDVASGERGRRGAYLEELLATLCEAPAATVVNNCAAALVLMLRHFTSGGGGADGAKREVIISRGELVQIGGGFRVPEILEASGAVLREVGATNRTDLADYARAMCERTALVLKVHRSNFWMEGFVESPGRAELAALAASHKVPMVEDLGSGATALTAQAAGKPAEPTPAEVLAAGVDLVCFSGDKLFGGPQAGVIAGRAALVAAMKKEPLFRAFRCDKLVMAGLEETAAAHLRRATAEVPVARLLGADVQALHARATALCEQLADVRASIRIVETTAQVGGGALPRARIPSVALQVVGRECSIEELARRLRAGGGEAPVVVAYRSVDALRLDLRTVFPDQDGLLADALRKALGS